MFVSESIEGKAADHDFGCGLGAHASVTSMYNISKDQGMREFDISYQSTLTLTMFDSNYT